ncbi:hypothetical protein [Levilactobacillus sp. FUA 3915]|uniref:hypothetical protein n=1 Tax=Levilactobacillus sp. FUA 3915 TaxID=3411093 RepID=UPI003756C8FE
MSRDAVGARLEPKSGLQAYFEPLGGESQRYQLPKRQTAKATPTAKLIFADPAADTSLTRKQRCIFGFYHQQIVASTKLIR